MRGSAQTVFGNLNWSTVIQGVTPDYVEAREWGMASGRMLGAQDVDGAAKVAVLGDTVWHSLFGDTDPIGADDPDQEGPVHRGRASSSRRGSPRSARTRTT